MLICSSSRIAAATLSVLFAAPAAAWEHAIPPSLPSPLTITPVAGVMQVDGTAVQSYAITSAEDPATAVEAIARHWARERPSAPVVRARAGAWLVVGRGEPAAHETVQLRATAHGSTGFYARPRTESVDRASPLPLQAPRGSRILRRVASRQGPERSEQVVLRVNVPPRTAAAELLANAHRAGWREPSPSRLSAAPSSRAEARAVRLVRDADELVIAIVPLAGGTASGTESSGAGIVLQHLRTVPR